MVVDADVQEEIVMQFHETTSQIPKTARRPDARQAHAARPAPRDKRTAPEWKPVVRAEPGLEVRPRHYGAGF
jgi:hypothetical protein